MKLVDQALVDALSAGTATLCHCWLFARSDGMRFGATDHDRELVIDGVECRPQSGLSGAEFRTGADLALGQAATSGVLSSDFLTEADLIAGLWDGARVAVYRVDWSAPQNRVHIWSGRVGEVIWSGAAFRAELVSLKADFEARIGRVYSRNCDAEIGDARCGVDLSSPAHRAEGAVSDVYPDTRLRLPAIQSFSTGFFTGGRLTLPGGASVRIQSQEGAVLNLASRALVSVGDVVVATAGCDKRYTTCGEVFANTENFRGFPHLPGMDAVISGPAGDGSDDGSKR